MAFIASRAAHLLDLFACCLQHVVPKWSPVQGAFVTYHAGRSWRFDAWREGGAWILEAGKWELVVDMKHL